MIRIAVDAMGGDHAPSGIVDGAVAAARHLDIQISGATVECRPQHLLPFAIMGVVFARVALGADRPRVGLLSIGEDPQGHT